MFLFVAYLLILNDRNIQILRVPCILRFNRKCRSRHSDSCSSLSEGKVSFRSFIQSNNEMMLLLVIQNCKDSWIHMAHAAAVDEMLNTLSLSHSITTTRHHAFSSAITRNTCAHTNTQHVCAHTLTHTHTIILCQHYISHTLMEVKSCH